mgnify:CR=1 FL=1|jgi:hypothetical protein
MQSTDYKIQSRVLFRTGNFRKVIISKLLIIQCKKNKRSYRWQTGFTRVLSVVLLFACITPVWAKVLLCN